MNDIELAYFINLVSSLHDRFQDEELNLAFMGYPDIVVRPSTYETLLSEDARRLLVNRSNADKLAQIHRGKTAAEIDIVPTIESLLAAIVFDRKSMRSVFFTVFDFQIYEGTEVLHDFNEPISIQHHNRFHLLWNGGTIEHIFDISTALMNTVYITRAGGYMYHAGPLNMFNHGFFNLCPVLFDNFFAVNGCRVINAQTSTLNEPYETNNFFNPSERLKVLPARECILMIMGEKLEHRDKLVKPTQGRYVQKEDWI